MGGITMDDTHEIHSGDIHDETDAMHKEGSEE